MAKGESEPQSEKPPLADRLNPVAFAWTGAKAVCVLLAAWLVLGLGVEAVGLWHFPLEKVEISGNRTVPGDDLIAVAGIAVGQPLGAMDPYSIAARLAAHPKLASADVRRIFPGRLMIAAQEREPAAVLRFSNSGRAVIDRDGQVLEMTPAGVPELRALPRIEYDLPHPAPGSRLTGEGLTQALGLLSDASRFGLGEGERLRIDANRPSGLVLHLPERKQRVLLPRAGLERALLAYIALAASLPDGPQGNPVIDMRAIRPVYGGRAILGR